MKKPQTMIEKALLMKESVFIFFLFLTSFLFRLPTLFNDFYDVDELAAIVQTKEYLAGFRPGIDFAESKLPLYHAIFKFSYNLNAEYGWVIVHFITILFVFLTALCIYHIGRLIRDRKTGIAASLLYAVLISSFNRHFMATNGEVIYNLPVTAGLLFFLLVIKSPSLLKKCMYLLLTAGSIYAAMMVKFHGIILLLFILFFLVFYIPYHRGMLKKMILICSGLMIISAAVFLADYFITRRFAADALSKVMTLVFYATSGRSSNPFFLLAIYSYRQLTIGIWHAVIWIPAAVYLFRFIKNGFRWKTIEESAVALFALVTFAMIFAAGARLYYHYFMSAYPSLCIAAAIALFTIDVSAVKKMKKHFTAALLIPGLFFLSWNVKDLYIKHFNQDLFFNEPKALFYFRAVVVSSMDDYLLPSVAYKDTADYIKKNTKPSDTIFVWGDGPHLYYFADRRIAIGHVWPKGGAIRIEQLYKENTPSSVNAAKAMQMDFINRMEQKKPALFIDTAPKGLHRSVTKLGSFAKFPYVVPAEMRKYLNKNYRLETVVDEYKIYRRIK